MPEIARAVLALQALEAALPRQAAQLVPRGPGAGAELDVAVVPVRLRPPAEIVALRGAAARPSPPTPEWPWLVNGFDYFKKNFTWFFFILTALFPRLMIAVAARTVRAMASQFFMEFGACGLDLAGSVFDTAADTLAGIESRVINATGSGSLNSPVPPLLP